MSAFRKRSEIFPKELMIFPKTALYCRAFRKHSENFRKISGNFLKHGLLLRLFFGNCCCACGGLFRFPTSSVYAPTREPCPRTKDQETKGQEFKGAAPRAGCLGQENAAKPNVVVRVRGARVQISREQASARAVAPVGTTKHRAGGPTIHFAYILSGSV